MRRLARPWVSQTRSAPESSATSKRTLCMAGRGRSGSAPRRRLACMPSAWCGPTVCTRCRLVALRRQGWHKGRCFSTGADKLTGAAADGRARRSVCTLFTTPQNSSASNSLTVLPHATCAPLPAAMLHTRTGCGAADLALGCCWHRSSQPARSVRPSGSPASPPATMR
jgi:hypothetical protein